MRVRAKRAREGEGRTLVVILCQTRAWELTYESFQKNVIHRLNADLALCVGAGEAENPLYRDAKYVWAVEEPGDWAKAFDRAAGTEDWKALLELDEMLLGGIESDEFPQVGSGAIILWFRHVLAECLADQDVMSNYEWLIVTRSDFLWECPHPPTSLLDSGRIYVLDGEQYGGVSDRHHVVPRGLVAGYLSIVEGMFESPAVVADQLGRMRFVTGSGRINPEFFLAARLRALGLWDKIRYLPYIAYAVRLPGGSTSWSVGEFDESLGFYVKYPDERRRSEVALGYISEGEDWTKFLSPLRGLPQRLGHRAELKRSGLLQRPMSRFTRRPREAYRTLRWRCRG
jgi:hypothetical protein